MRSEAISCHDENSRWLTATALLMREPVGVSVMTWTTMIDSRFKGTNGGSGNDDDCREALRYLCRLVQDTRAALKKLEQK